MNESNALLHLLQEHMGQTLSEQIICEKLRLESTSVSDGIARLREKGHVIDWSSLEKSYSLKPVLDQLKPQDIHAYLKTNFIGQDVHYFPELNSFTDKAFQLAERYPMEGESVTPLRKSPMYATKKDIHPFAGNGSVIVSELATQDGIWPVHSAGINLYASVVLRPGILPSRAPQIALVAVVALARALDSISSVRPVFQWPNTLLVDGKTLAKIKMRMSSNVEKINFLILGFDVNLNGLLADITNPQSERVTSLRMLSGKMVNRPFFAATLFKELEKSYITYVNKGPEKIIRELNHYFTYKNKEIIVQSCGANYVGTIEGFDVDGILLLRSKDGTVHRIPAGNISPDQITF